MQIRMRDKEMSKDGWEGRRRGEVNEGQRETAKELRGMSYLEEFFKGPPPAAEHVEPWRLDAVRDMIPDKSRPRGVTRALDPPACCQSLGAPAFPESWLRSASSPPGTANIAANGHLLFPLDSPALSGCTSPPPIKTVIAEAGFNDAESSITIFAVSVLAAAAICACCCERRCCSSCACSRRRAPASSLPVASSPAPCPLLSTSFWSIACAITSDRSSPLCTTLVSAFCQRDAALPFEVMPCSSRKSPTYKAGRSPNADSGWIWSERVAQRIDSARVSESQAEH